MSALPRFQTDIRDNPVARAEAKHLLRGKASWFWRALYAVTAFTLIAPLLWGFGIHFHKTLEIVVIILVMLNVIGWLAVEMKAITSAVRSITREYQGKTWELLLMTGVDSWRLILGKWLGVIRSMLRDYSWLYVVRIGTFLWGVALHGLLINGFRIHCYSDWCASRYKTGALLSDIQVANEWLIFVFAIILIYTFWELALITSLSIVMAMLKWTRRHAAWMTLVLRIGLAIGFGIIFLWLAGQFEHYWDLPPDQFDDPYTLIVTLASSLSDNATISSSMYFDDNTYAYYPPQAILAGQILGLLPYVLLTGMALYLSKAVASWQERVSQPGLVMKMKPKPNLRLEMAIAASSTVVGTSQHGRVNGIQEQTMMAKTQPGSENVFNITKPTAYRCQVYHYHRRLSRLYLSVFKGQQNVPVLYLLFSDVGYIEGPMNWQSADFYIASKEECVELMLKAGLIGEAVLQFPDAYAAVTDTARLYLVKTLDKPVKIIASSASILQNIPADLE